MDQPRHVERAPVGAPAGLRHHVEPGLTRNLARVAAIGIGDPQIDHARAIADERDLLAVGREDRMRLERRAGQQRPRLPAFDRQRVEIAEQIEHDAPPVGRDIGLHPAALARLEREERGRVLLLCGGGGRAKRRRQQCGKPLRTLVQHHRCPSAKAGLRIEAPTRPCRRDQRWSPRIPRTGTCGPRRHSGGWTLTTMAGEVERCGAARFWVG